MDGAACVHGRPEASTQRAAGRPTPVEQAGDRDATAGGRRRAGRGNGVDVRRCCGARATPAARSYKIGNRAGTRVARGAVAGPRFRFAPAGRLSEAGPGTQRAYRETGKPLFCLVLLE